MARILVIDDEKNIRKMVRLTLERAGHTVEVAEDGQTGLSAFGSGEQWDLVLVDQRMPGIEGCDVIRQARRRDQRARIVMMTAFDRVELAAEAVEAGAADFLRKPFTTEMLRGAVSAVLFKGRPAPFDLPKIPQSGAGSETAAHSSSELISYFLNGFSYFPASMERLRLELPEGFDTARAYRIVSPVEGERVCVVAVMPHVVMQLQRGERRVPPSDPLWDLVCGMALADYLWERATMPPSFLPVYTLSSRQLDAVRRQSGRLPELSY